LVWVADRGFASAANRAYLTRGGGHYIHAEKLRNTNSEAAAALARPGRYRTVAGNRRVKEVAVAPGGDGDGAQGARAQRFVVCHNPEQADRDAAVRTRLVTHPGRPQRHPATWTHWWNDVADLFPNQVSYAAVEREQQRLPLANFTSGIPIPAGWTGRPAAYLAFGETYAAEPQRAIEAGWPTMIMEGGHLHPLRDPAAVGAAVLELSRTAAP